MTITTSRVATGRSDAEDRLIDADGPLAQLQKTCGGALGSTIAIPELLALVEKSRLFGLKLARQFEAVDDDDRITAWAEITPIDGGSGGCDIAISSWQTRPLPPENSIDTDRRKVEINRGLAECTARLDAAQNLLSVDTDAADLADFAAQALAGLGRPWTDFVEIAGAAHEQPMHWRLLDGAECRIAGSRRSWTAHLEPLGQQSPGSDGFVLHLSADTPRADQPDETAVDTPSLGRDLTPVLRQPINRIIANAETIRTKLAGPLAEEYSQYAADIASAGQHLLALVDDLSDLEIVESEDFVTEPDRIELADVARRACGILGVRARERGIVLVPPAEGESQLAIAEFRRVLQIMLNLVGNAIRYSPEESQVWLRLDRIGSRAMITVADQGHGLDEAQQARVFEKFERLGRSGDGGSGLGLYISRRIARAMDGDLTVESAPGLGARFTLSVPAADDMRSLRRGGPGHDVPDSGELDG